MTRLLLALALALSTLVAVPPPASAQGEQDRALKLVEQGLGHARAKRFEKAAELFEEAIRLYPHPEFFHNLARAQEEMKQLSAAYAYFSEALRLDPNYVYAKEARERMTRIEGTLRKTHGLVRVRSVPSQVNVSLEAAGHPVERHLQTPVERWIPAGTLTLTGRRPEFQDESRQYAVVAGEEQTIELVLRPIERKGFLDVTANAPGAQVFINGTLVDAAPIRGVPYPVGSYSLEVRARGYQPYRQAIVVEADKPTTIAAAMTPDLVASGDDEGSDLGGTLLLSGGGVALVTGAVLHALAISKSNDAVPAGAEFDDEYNRRQSSVRALEVGAYVAYGVGAALAGVGAWLLWGDDDTEGTGEAGLAAGLPETVAPVVVPTRGGAVMGASLRF